MTEEVDHKGWILFFQKKLRCFQGFRMKQKKVIVSVEGTRPLLFHRFNVEVLDPERKAKSGSVGNNPEEWRDTFFFTDQNQLYVPGLYFFVSIKAGAAYTKVGRGTILKKVSATLQVEDEIVLLDRFLPDKLDNIKTEDFPRTSAHPVFLDIRGVNNPVSKGKNVRYRLGCSAGWNAKFTIAWDPTIVSEEVMKRVVEDAGTLIGVGDGRSLGFGKFIVTDWIIDKM